MLKHIFLILLTISFFVSCKNNENTPKNKTISADSLVFAPSPKTDISKTEGSTSFYKKRLNDAETKFRISRNNGIKLQQKNQDLNEAIDSLTIVINTLRIEEAKKKERDANKKKINKQEERIQTLISNFLQSWDNLPKTKDTKTVTEFFAKKYRCNRISIDHDNTAQISWHTEKDFDDYIKSLFLKKGWTFKTTNVKFLDTEIKDDLYFNSTFKYSLDTYKKDKLIDKSNFIVTITGKKIDNEYKIVNYSWVRFSFM